MKQDYLITQHKKRDRKKAAVLKALDTVTTNITEACKISGVERRMYYIWRQDDPDFRLKCDEILEKEIDWVENELKNQIASGNTTATIFYLKCKAKHRGYIDHQIDVNVTTPLQINYIIPKDTDQ